MDYGLLSVCETLPLYSIFSLPFIFLLAFSVLLKKVYDCLPIFIQLFLTKFYLLIFTDSSILLYICD